MIISTPIRRKIQYVAGSTYVISLPKKWVHTTISEDPKEVKKNQIIIIPMQDGSLNIYPDGLKGIEKSETILKLDKKHVQDNDYFQKRMIAKYLAGHQQIRLTSEDIIGPEIIKRTEEIVRMFIGCEIIEMSPNVLVIKDLLALGELSIEKALNMMNIIARSTFKTALRAIISNDEMMALEVANLEDKIDQYHYLITRQLNSVLANPNLLLEHGLKLTEIIGFYSVSRLIEQISDQAAKSAIVFLEMKKLAEFETIYQKKEVQNILSTLKILLPKLEEISKKSMEVFFERDSEGAYTTINRCWALLPSITALEQLSYQLPSSDHEFALKYVSICNMITKLTSYFAYICELAMDRAELM